MPDPGTIIALGALIVTVVVAVSAASWTIRGSISGSVQRVHDRLDTLGAKMDENDVAARDRSDAMKSELLDKIDQGDRYLAERVSVVENRLGDHVQHHAK